MSDLQEKFYFYYTETGMIFEMSDLYDTTDEALSAARALVATGRYRVAFPGEKFVALSENS
jgi:hypothetical protein